MEILNFNFSSDIQKLENQNANQKIEIKELNLKLEAKNLTIQEFILKINQQDKIIENLLNHLKNLNSTTKVEHSKPEKCENDFHAHLTQFVFLLVCIITILNVVLFINLKRQMEKPKINRRWDMRDLKESGTRV